MHILGLDFTSSWSSSAKANHLVEGVLDGHVPNLQEVRRLESPSKLATVLSEEGPWVLGLDFPFGLPDARVTELAARHKLPAMYSNRPLVDAGGLMVYDADRAGLEIATATYVDRILKGAKPADLPVEQPTKFELVINLKTAKALGLTIPPSVLGRADQVIE
jgi:ABC transporter substrate binding protein